MTPQLFRRSLQRTALQDSATMSRPRAGWLAVVGGFASALGTALITGFLLLVNGSFTLVFLTVVAQSGPKWFSREDVMQFLLFVIPLLMVVGQWLLWDLIWGALPRRDADGDPWNCT